MNAKQLVLYHLLLECKFLLLGFRVVIFNIIVISSLLPILASC